MADLGKVLVLAILTLVSTTIDDFVVLLTFCSENEASPLSREEKRSNYIKIAGGYLAGFTVVVIISLIGLVLSYLVEPEYIALLGFIPILIGLKMLYEAYQEDACMECYNFLCGIKKPEEEEEKPNDYKPPALGAVEDGVKTDQPRSPTSPPSDQKPVRRHSHVPKHPSITGIVVEPHHTPEAAHHHPPAAIKDDNNLKDALLDHYPASDAPVPLGKAKQPSSLLDNNVTVTVNDKGEEIVGDEEMNYFAKKFEDAMLAMGINRQFVIVAATTFSVGSDNIAVYVSLFSQTNGTSIALIIAVFYFMTTMYALICIWVIGSVEGLGATLDILAKPVVPFVLMGIGAYILADSIIFQ
jgi:cadmium resistance protein CadD (predicted permease)